MPALASDLRRQLESVVIQARDLAEAAARAALKRLAVDAIRPFEHFSDEQKRLRNRLRARARQAGDQRKSNGEQEIDQLTQELAYEYWHRMLFARFLAENHLLMHPDGVAVSLAECDELAKLEGADNGWGLAARYASRMLPQIFRTDDVLLDIEFPINARLPLERLLARLPPETFTADDSLGWVYQFWQSKKKDEVNKSGQKIDGLTLPAVTQLFTEPYMVKFLLHNTIGAWWCARHGIKGPPGGAGAPAGQAPVEMEYLRWRNDGTPAAGTIDGWPKTLKEFTMLDPCCGSGHFLVEAFHLLVALRMHDEGVSAREACDAVLSENLFGLEIDPRCTQIAAFALALAAWKYPDESGQALGYRPLPPLNMACSGLSVTGKKEEWLTLANGDSRLLEGMSKLYDLFRQAPHLGSLIDPRREAGDLISAEFAELQPLLGKALVKEKVQRDADAAAVGVATQGIARAADLLAKRYTLVATNVPFLGRGRQIDYLRDFCEAWHSEGKADLATSFFLRCIAFCQCSGTVSLVGPQNWLFLKNSEIFRRRLLKHVTWNFVIRLGPNSFDTISGEVVNVGLFIFSSQLPSESHKLAGIDVVRLSDVDEKRLAIQSRECQFAVQRDQLKNPDARLLLENLQQTGELLSDYADSYLGLGTGDYARFGRCFWELGPISREWAFQQGPVKQTIPYGGREHVIFWDGLTGRIRGMTEAEREQIHNQDQSGRPAWGKTGIGVSLMRELYVTLYTGEPFDKAMAVLVPLKREHLPALWAFCNSPEFGESVRRLDHKTIIANGTLVKIPFDVARWLAVAEKENPNGLPEPNSDDLTQWLFEGDIGRSTDPFQVAVARMLGYRWPEQPKEEDIIDALADKDGIVCIPAVRGERPAGERLLDVLRTAYGAQWSDAILHKLLTDDGCRPGTSLDEWLRDKFFEQHCKGFHHRPFIWHIWDGRKDGFACLVNYHKLDRQRLETLTYAYLQDWITSQVAAARDGRPGADLRLAAAQELQSKLKLILAGEPPYDIFVRWKPIHEQPIGWNPDLNDGVRVNIRPFVMANVLRKPPNIKWTKDRGKEPERAKEQFPWFWERGTFKGDRINDYHLTNAQKREARDTLAHG